MIDIHQIAKTKKIGIAFSQFDLLHAGHICMLAEAKTHCDFLIVGLHNNANEERPKKNVPVQSIYERQLVVSSIKYVDDIIVYNTEKDLENILLTLPIHIRFLGSEYRMKVPTGLWVCKNKKIEVKYIERDHDFSSSNLREKIICQSTSS